MTTKDDAPTIAGSTAAEIAASIRALIERSELSDGDALPPVRALAERLGVNRNTAVAAYRQLAQSGLVLTQGRAGTRVAARPPLPGEGFADTVLTDLGAGNPDPALIPDLSAALPALDGRPALYGEPVIEPALERWANEWMAADLTPSSPALTLTNGSFDAVERLLAQALTRDDAVALEDPCFLATIRTARLAGYRPVPVSVDEHGMTPDGLRRALEAGVRAVVITPRAQNPTGASLSRTRARDLRAVLADHPYVLVIEDDHFSLLSQRPYLSVIPRGQQRFALVRSVSKFLGPDLGLAFVASDAETAARLALRLSPGTTWVSHILQRIALALLTDPDSRALIARAGVHYAERNSAFVARLSPDFTVTSGEGLTLWLDVGQPAQDVAAALMRRGWLVRTGDEFQLDADAPSRHLRLTVHHLTDAQAAQLATDLASAR
ncbi:MAG: aminotransferase class I/II-fold pyridoxal phosphate-dependent enzyme [Microbacterium sp.]